MMHADPVLVTGPIGHPVSLEQAKLHLRADGDDEDGLITGLIAAAVEHLDGYHGILGRCLLPQVWRQSFSRFAPEMTLRPGPVTGIMSVTYLGPDGVRRDVDGPRLLSRGGRVWLLPPAGQSWPRVAPDAEAVQVDFRAGQEVVPTPIKQAILLLVGHWYANREAVVASGSPAVMPLAVDRLLSPYRKPGV